MFLQHPIFPMIIAILTMFVAIINSVQNEKLSKR